MSEKRFIISKNTSERSITGIIDVERQTHLWVKEVVDLLNEQSETIEHLEEECGARENDYVLLQKENEQLRTELEQERQRNRLQKVKQ